MALLTLAELKAGALWSVKDTDYDAVKISDAYLERVIAAQTEAASAATFIAVSSDPTAYLSTTERHDEPIGHSYSFALRRRPVRAVTACKLRYGNLAVLDVPVDWVDVVHPNRGTVQLLPTHSGVNSGALGSAWFLAAQGRLPAGVPGPWEFTYTYGFNETDAPAMFKRVVELRAANAFMKQAADNVIGPAIASRSISMGGVSTSVGSTASAMYSAYSAQMEANQKEIADLESQLRALYAGPFIFMV